MSTVLKVTAFILRPAFQATAPQGAELLLLRHPTAGVQLPAGTVEPGEAHAAAAVREACEETGLHITPPAEYLGLRTTTLPRAVTVTPLRARDGYMQVEYIEWDDYFQRNYITYHITGWVPAELLSDRLERHFYLFTYPHPTLPEWEVAIDNHLYRPFWAPLEALPALIPPQNYWLSLLAERQPTFQVVPPPPDIQYW